MTEKKKVTTSIITMTSENEELSLDKQAQRIDVGVTDTGHIIIALSDLDSFISLTPDDLEVVVEALMQAYEASVYPDEEDVIH